MSSSSVRNRKTALQGAPEPIAALNRIVMTELSRPWQEREPLVDIRTYCPEVVPVESICPYLRHTVADRVNQAQASLPEGYRLKVGTALRTLGMQKGGWDGYFKRMREQHPNWPLSALRRATNKYFAPYDQKAPPGHCTGGAIDVSLLDAAGNTLDLVAPTKGWEAAYTWSDKLSQESKANRMLMVEAMLGAGFSNCRDEYWHYSWGDSAWAVRTGERECPYGWTYPPVVLEADFPSASAQDLHMETTRDFQGRPLHAEGSCTVSSASGNTPEGLPFWSVGLYWANGISVTVNLGWPTACALPTLFAGDGKERWNPITDVHREGQIVRLHISPDADRIILTNYVKPSSTELS